MEKKSKYLIIEDERFAYEELKRMMKSLRPDYELCGWATSVEQAIQLVSNMEVNLMLVDIRLSDGNSFDFFEQIKSQVPVIFTTAYDEYALKAFKVNSIDYLLKPIEEKDLEHAIVKYENLQCITPLSSEFQKLRNDYITTNRKNRFLVQTGDAYGYVEVQHVAFFYSEDKYTFLHTFEDKRYIVPYTLDQLDVMLEQAIFFRVSRNCISNIRSISKIVKYFAGRLKISFSPPCPHEIIVSRNRADNFLNWINGNEL